MICESEDSDRTTWGKEGKKELTEALRKRYEGASGAYETTSRSLTNRSLEFQVQKRARREIFEDTMWKYFQIC